MNSWLRLWHDMPTDPKFRTIAKVSKQPLCTVIAVYTFMLVDASNATERGKTQSNDEDVASALDLEIEQVEIIRKAMQGRVLEENYLTGWEKRQPKREDDSAERSRAWREKQKKIKEEECKQTQPNAEKRSDTDTDTNKDTTTVHAHEDSYKNEELQNDLGTWQQFLITRNKYQLHIVKKLEVVQMLIDWVNKKIPIETVTYAADFADAKLGKIPDSPMYYKNFVEAALHSELDKNKKPDNKKFERHLTLAERNAKVTENWLKNTGGLDYV